MKRNRISGITAFRKKIQRQYDDHSKWLILSNHPLRISQVKCIVQGPSKMKYMRMLYLSFIDLNNDRLKVLCKGDWPNLQFLDLSENILTDQGIQYLGTSNWNKLQKIRLYFNTKISSKGMYTLLRLKQSKFHALKQLNISDTNIGFQGAKFLVQTNWKSLSILNLDRCKLGNEGAKNLSKGEWPQLIQFTICGNKINQQGAKQLCKLRLPKLTIFSVNDNPSKSYGVINFYTKLQVPQLLDYCINYQQMFRSCRETVKKLFKENVQLQYIHAGEDDMEESYSDDDEMMNQGDQDNQNQENGSDDEWEDMDEEPLNNDDRNN